MHPDLALALELADVADGITLGRFRATDLVVDTKPDLTPVSEADRAVERALRERLARERPDEPVLGEEEGGAESAAGARWIIDPIDATKNYVRGIPVFATLIALERDGDGTVGVVSAPALGRRWWAARGEGAFADGKPLRVSRVARLEDAVLTYTSAADFFAQSLGAAFEQLTGDAWAARGYGDFWQYVLLAEGTVDVAVEPVAAVWDLAAPKVIVEEAGGRVTDFRGIETAGGGSCCRLQRAAARGRARRAASVRTAAEAVCGHRLFPGICCGVGEHAVAPAGSRHDLADLGKGATRPPEFQAIGAASSDCANFCQFTPAPRARSGPARRGAPSGSPRWGSPATAGRRTGAARPAERRLEPVAERAPRRPCSAAPPAPTRSPRASGSVRHVGDRVDGERVELLDPRDRDVARACAGARGRRCRSRPCPVQRTSRRTRSRSALGSSRTGRKPPSARSASVDDGVAQPQQALRRHHDERPRRGVERLPPQQMEVLRRRRAGW